jgi:hypothetical protein
VTSSTKRLIPAVLAVAAVAAFWFMVLSPKRDQMAKLDTEITAQQATVAQAEQQAASYEKAKANYRTNYTMIARLGKAVTGDDDVRSLLVQIDQTAKRSKVDFRNLTVGGAAAAPGTTTAKQAPGTLAPPPGTVPVGSAGFSAMPFTFTFKGSYFRLTDFFNRLERFVTVQNGKLDVTGRLLLLGSIAVTPQTSTGSAPTDLQAQIGAAAYLLPPTTAVPGTTPPATTAGAAGATPPAGAGGTTSVPTATITGVR